MAMIDRREIAFDAAGLLAVVDAMHRAAESFGLPGQTPHTALFLPAEDQVEFRYGTAHQPMAVRMKGGAVGALLISYCVRAHIPMPKAAEKGLRIESGAAVLTFRIAVDKLPLPSSSPAQPKPAPAPVRVGARLSWA